MCGDCRRCLEPLRFAQISRLTAHLGSVGVDLSAIAADLSGEEPPSLAYFVEMRNSLVVDEEGDLDELLRALAHPVRRAILVRCVGDWVAVGLLVAEFDLANATVSEHLKVLRKTRLVTMAIDGTFRLYRTDPQRLDAATKQLAHLLPTPSRTKENR
jgi:DNA-binding transcriptional ArsR family regulator